MLRSFGFLAILQGSTALECHKCRGKIDSSGVLVSGDETCWTVSADESLVVTCDEGKDLCGIEIYSDWAENGKQYHEMLRGCMSSEDFIVDTTTSCVTTDAGIIGHTRDCIKTCDSDKCNTDDLLEMMKTDMATNNVAECNQCDGQDECLSDDNQAECPFYADNACFNHRTEDISADGEIDYSIIKGCSAFSQKHECHLTTTEDTQTGIHQLKNCRSTCQEELCNYGEPKAGLMCYKCEYHQDHTGKMIGLSDPTCWNGQPSDEYAEECNDGEQCLLDMQIDWPVGGYQEVIVRRRCGTEADLYPGSNGCYDNLQFPLPEYIYRDCSLLCDGDRCNGAEHFEEVALQHSTGREPGTLECHTCSFTERPDSSVSGNDKCRAYAMDTPTNVCPTYADTGCFTAGHWINQTIGETVSIFEEDHRGCSSFVFNNFNNNNGDCHTSVTGNTVDSNCKYTCDGSQCNQSPLAKRRQCHTCNAAIDVSGAPVGTTNNDCWDDPRSSPILECENEDDICAVEIIADWFTRGNHLAQVKRGCVAANTKTECSEGSTGRNMFKDCIKPCVGNACNTYTDEVSEMFNPEGPTVDSCLTCFYTESDGGYLNGNVKCLDNPKEFSKPCPAYANRGCFLGTNSHVWGDTEVAEEIYRGCSTFVIDDEVCYEQNLNSITGELHAFGICKSACEGRNCNDGDRPEIEIPIEGDYPMCQECSVSFDQNNNTVGTGDLDCIDGHKRFNQLCPNKGDICLTEMTADWQSRGRIDYRIVRSCSSGFANENCFEGQTNLISYKDCQIQCDPTFAGAGCNNGLKDISEKFSTGTVSECFACEYFEKDDGNVQGIPNCLNEINPMTTKIPIHQCPKYADSSCYHAASFHSDYLDNGNDFEDDYRGCAPFQAAGSDNRPYCVEATIGGFEHKNCKEICQDDLCNTNRINKAKRCYTCQETRNGQNETIGVSNSGCFDKLDDSMIVDCAQDEDYCFDEMVIDWLPKGEQQIWIKRGCSAEPAPGPCQSGEGQNVKYKDCQTSCYPTDDQPCNNDLSVADKYRIGAETKVTSCHSCRYVEHDNGDVEGNKNCENNPAVGDCPVYADIACYTGAATHNALEAGNVIREIYKGCSTFVAKNGEEDKVQELPNPDSGTVQMYGITKTSCNSDNCNKEHKAPQEPEIPDDPEPEIENRCQVCSVTVDQYERQIGTGQIGCWNGDSAFEKDCGSNEYCVVDMEVDWLPRGHFNYRVVRGCRATPAPENCYSAGSNLVQYKDCSVSCKIEEDGPGCNNGLTDVALKFSVGNVSECYRCEYYEDYNGNVAGFPFCGDKIDVSNTQVELYSCPLFADAACYWAGSYHDDYSNADVEFEDDFRGCSPFTMNRNDECVSNSIQGLDHLNCKGTCSEDKCNTDEILRHLQCNQCQTTVDAEGNLVGSGDRRCFDNPGTEFMADCPAGTTHCTDHMMVDWFSRGFQYYTMTRGCAPIDEGKDYDEPMECANGMSSKFVFRDCYAFCKEDGCNNDMTAGQLHQDENGYLETSCYACNYVESDDGSVSGNTNCPDSPTDDLKKSCPAYANQACFTGTAIHNFDGEDKEEVYKGCSAFDLGSPLYDTDEISGIEYRLIKETCRGPNCNEGHLGGSENPACHVCTIRKDHLGNIINGDSDCWSDALDGDNSKFMQNCFNENDVCITELTVDWIPKGEQVATLQRRCGPRPTLPGGNVCSEISMDTGMEKKCISYCDTSEDGNLCNNNLSVEDEFDAGNDAVHECYSCLYGEWYNGNVLEGSNIYCQAPDATGLVPTQSCPKYLNAACYTAATWHSDGNNDFEEDYKGCSAFKLDDNQVTCSDYVVNGVIYKNCKSTCDDDNCNKVTPTKTMSCYTCDHTVDAEGNSVGLASMESCFFDVPNPSYIEECAQDENFCKSDLEADWFFGGMMTWRIRRGCAKSAASSSCTEFSHNSDQMHFKDCQTSCMGANCNTGTNALFNKFDSGRPDEISCYSCSYLENDDGTNSGNRFCMDEADRVDGAMRICPRYANHGCFVGSNLHENQDGNQVEQVYKGCSSFVVQSPICDIQYDFNAGSDTYDLAVCKEFCNEGLCNKEHNRPELDDSNYQRCYTCQATQDHSGNNVGSGDPNCWDIPTRTESQICDTDDVCLTMVSVDWSPMGEQLVHISRGCRAPRETPTQGIPCTEVTSNDGTFHVKTCEETCFESECVVDFETVENHFDQGNDITCYDCIYGKLADGSFLPNSNINCREPVASDETVRLKECPKLMNAACFTASSFHTSLKGEYDRDFKGCSAFKLDGKDDQDSSDDECITYTSNGEVHTTCKQTCSSDKCNRFTPTKVLSCYTCDTTVDGLNNTIGYGQADCWSESPNPKYMEECTNGEEFCKTDIEADWLINGKQSWRIRRGCSNGPAPQSCYEFSGNGMHLKDCTTTCTKSGCNNGLYETAALYDQIGPDFNCYTCEHIQNENGIDSGNSNCGDEPDKIEDASKLCPVYANAGCYAGTNAHYDAEAVLYEQVYKGCSTFSLPETECGTLIDITIDGNKADYGVCKETCFGNNCNRYHEHPTINSKSCYSCSIMKDHMGNTLGYADENCWENPSPLDRVQCASDDICLTEMKVEWFPKGEQIMSFERKCGKVPEESGAFTCSVESDELYKKKHCVKKCSKEDNNCNNDRDIEDLFYDGEVSECFECTYGVFYDGTTLPNSNLYCQNPTAQEGFVPLGICPKYASKACYTAATWHFAQNGDEYEEDFKGCSTFAMEEDEDECASYIQNGLTYNNCRQTCTGDKCNRKTPTRRKSCYSCSATVDALNNTLGFGDASCFSETPNPNNVRECSSGQDHCVSTMLATWEWDGSMTWSITRGCSFNPAIEDCSIINGESVTTKMCGISCTDSNCNTGLTPIASKFSSGKVDSCYVCDYLENDDGSVSGNQNCPDNADQLPDGASKCPIYADSACFTGSNAHYSSDMVLREQIHKGCSSFSSVYMRQSPQTDRKCDVHKEILIDGVEYDYGVCRETCGTSNCNVDHEIAVIDRTECYSCSIQKDFMGNIIGQGDGSCWNSPNPSDTEYCTGDQVCLTEMTVEWWSKGEQTVSLQRRCGNKPVGGNWACGVNDMAPYLAKSCNAACEGDLCNNDLEIEDYFAENNVEECFSCTYGEFYNGNALPNSNLYCTNPIAEVGTVPTQKCPKYATAACFTAATWHYAANGDELEEDFKGCSAFKLDDADLQCDNYVINGITYNNCRSTCDDDNCNRLTPQKKKSCFTCAATFDAQMNLIGYGESSCFTNNPNPALTQECENEDDYCITDLEADWFLNGRQEYRIRRGCSAKAIDEGCLEGSASNDQMLYKDCTKTCTESFCNNDFDSVAEMFSTGRDLTCYSCKYLEYYNGAVSGNKNCGDNPELIPGTQPKCPIFANAGCFTGTNAQYNSEMTVIEEVYKGCSSFAYPSQKCDVLLGISVPGQEEPGTMGICKEGCIGDLCNKDHTTPEIP